MATIQDYANWAYNAGFRGNDLRTMTAIAWAESKGNPNAYNPAYGATGATQITPATWQDFGARMGLSNIYDPQQNFQAAYNIYSGKPYNKGGFKPWEPYTVPASHPNYYGRYLGMADQGIGALGQQPPAQQQTAAPLSYQAPQAPKPGNVHDWQRGLIQDIPTQFVPPNGGDITQWAWDQNQGRYFRKGDSGKPFDQIPSYSYDYGSGQWVGNNLGVRGQMLPQGAGIGGQKAARSSLQSAYDNTQSRQFQPPANAQPFYKGGMAGAQQALGPGGMTLSQLGQSYQNNTFGRMPQPQQPNLGSFNVGGSGMMMVANGNGVPMMRSPINTSSLGMSAQQPMMGFGAGRPALPVSPVGNGMMSYQGGTYSPAGLALSRMQSGIR